MSARTVSAAVVQGADFADERFQTAGRRGGVVVFFEGGLDGLEDGVDEGGAFVGCEAVEDVAEFVVERVHKDIRAGRAVLSKKMRRAHEC